MKKSNVIILVIAVFSSITILHSQVSHTSKGFLITKTNSLTTDIDSLSYVLGLNLAKQFNTDVKEIDTAIFIQGFLNGKESSDLLMSTDETQIRAFLNTYFKRKQEKELMEKHGAFKKQNEDFLSSNKVKEGVITTTSGLQYVVLKEGTGVSPVKSSTVKVHYHGTLIDGTVFDSSVNRGEPTTFKVGQVIKGWTEGLQLMKLGAKYKFFIPQTLAYGAREAGPMVKPFSTLIFEVELLEIK